mmetsp:Transcript_7707/g.18676  ORF Transcript_7707/g.18676 Transcript_7707/m.18676 type:complete len:208 (-) Transcript_7707:128-751(-)
MCDNPGWCAPNGIPGKDANGNPSPSPPPARASDGPMSLGALLGGRSLMWCPPPRLSRNDWMGFACCFCVRASSPSESSSSFCKCEKECWLRASGSPVALLGRGCGSANGAGCLSFMVGGMRGASNFGGAFVPVEQGGEGQTSPLPAQQRAVYVPSPLVVEQWLGCPPQTSMQEATSEQVFSGTGSRERAGGRQAAHRATAAAAAHHG